MKYTEMKDKLLNLKSRIKPVWLILAAAAIVVLVVVLVVVTQNNSTAARAAERQNKVGDVYTARVKRGSLVVSASGSGTLVPSQEVSLGFSSSGTVKTVNVVVGQKVQKGDVLAELGEVEALQASASAAELELTLADKDLQDFQANAAAALGNAKLALADAKDAYEDARNAVVTKDMQRCDDDAIEEYYYDYKKAQEDLDKVDKAGYDSTYYENKILPLRNIRDQKYAKYIYCAGFTDYEIESSEANLLIAQAAVKTAQEKLDTLEANDGLDPVELARYKNAVDKAKAAYAEAQKDLNGATITAPFSGTILSVDTKAGENVVSAKDSASSSGSISGTSVITMADLDHPEIEFSVDETDMDKVAVGYEAEITFDAIPDRVFTGKVTVVEPSLTSENGYQVLKGLIALNMNTEQQEQVLLKGLSASVEIIGGEAQNATLVSVDALRSLGDGSYAVFVVDQSGQLTMREVEIGIMDYTYAQVISGLKEGEQVSTGSMEAIQ